MRVFFLGRTPLGAVMSLRLAPGAGDVICCLRQAQDLANDGERLHRSGIAVAFADDLIDAEAGREIDAVGAAFLATWYKDGERDFSRFGKLSLGKSFAMELARQSNPRQLVRAGETLRRMLEAHPAATQVLTDLADGDGVYRFNPAYFPIRCVLEYVAKARGLQFIPLLPTDAIPPGMVRGNQKRWGRILKSLVSGFRPRWLQARMAFARKRRRCGAAPTLYMFIGHSQELVARRLAEGGKIDVVADRLGIDGADALRFDHVLALPTVADVACARRLVAAVKRLHMGADHHRTRYEYAGVDYGRILFGAVHAFLKFQIWPFLVVLAQSQRLQAMTGFSALFVNGGGMEPMGILIALNEDTRCKIYLLPHGMDMQRFAYPTAATDNPHVTNLAYGNDHADYFRTIPGPSPARPPVLTGNPLTVAMNEMRRNSRSRVHRKRLLVLAFGHLEFWNAARTYACDRYYAEVFSLLPALAEEGWTVSLRSHPTHPHEFENWIAHKLGVEHLIRWDHHATLQRALPAHDAVVGNLSTACYQALYAGWPTIIYEPDYRNAGGINGVETDPMLTGLLTARDLERPVTNDPVALARMIRESLDAGSMVSTFPARFAGDLAPRFIGPDPARADTVIAEFLERDILGETETPTLQAAPDKRGAA